MVCMHACTAAAAQTSVAYCMTFAAGEQLLVAGDPDSDLEQLIKGGPFELTLAANQLGSNLFGIHSAAQVQLGLSVSTLYSSSCARLHCNDDIVLTACTSDSLPTHHSLAFSKISSQTTCYTQHKLCFCSTL